MVSGEGTLLTSRLQLHSGWPSVSLRTGDQGVLLVPCCDSSEEQGAIPPEGLLCFFSKDFGIFVTEALVLGPVPLKELFSIR